MPRIVHFEIHAAHLKMSRDDGPGLYKNDPTANQD
jgi:hypothetical protein